MARNKFPGSSISLDALCKKYGIDNSIRTQHTALIDCDLLSKVYINLIDQKEPKLDFHGQDEIKDKDISSQKILYFKKIIKLTSKEKEKHSQYLKTNLKKNFF